MPVVGKTSSDSQVILDEIYTMVKPNFDAKKLKLCIERFVHKNHDSLYDYAPVDRIYWKDSDINDFFTATKIDIKEVTETLPSLYYWKQDELQACKDEFSLTCLMCLRYLLKEDSHNKSLIELKTCIVNIVIKIPMKLTL